MKQTDLIPTDDALRQAMQRRAERRKAECPPAANLEDIVMQRITQQAASPYAAGLKGQRSRVYRLILPALSAAAALLIGFLLWPDKETPSTPTYDHESQIAEIAPKDSLPSITTENIDLQEQPLMAQQTKQISRPAIQPTTRDGKRAPSVMRLAGSGSDRLKGVEEPLEDKIAGLTIVPTSADLCPGAKMRLGVPCPVSEEEKSLPEDVSPIPADKQALADIYLAEAALQVVYERKAQAEALRAYAASITGEEIPKAIIAF